MRRSLPVLALAAAAVTAASGARGQDPPARADTPRPFAPGERLVYDLKLGIFRVGRGSMELLQVDTVRGEPVFHVVFAIRGRAIFYSLTDTLESWFSVRDLTTRRFIQNNDDNGTLRYHRFDIHPDRGVYVRDDTDTAATVTDPLDEASFFYFARTVPLDEGRSYEFPRYFVPDRNPVTIRVLGRDTIEVPAGRFPTIVVRPIFKSRGLFSEGGQATVYFSDDAARIPVRITSRLSVGTLTLSLRERTAPP